eukprot:3608042-Rhodomonas_salina.2
MEDFVFPERYIGVDVPAKEGGRVQMSERYKQLFDVTPGGTNLHIGKIFYEPQTDCSGGVGQRELGESEVGSDGRNWVQPLPACPMHLLHADRD